MYRNFSDMPTGIKKKIEQVIGESADRWVHQPIPALHNKSIIEVMNLPEGELEVRTYLQRIESDSF